MYFLFREFKKYTRVRDENNVNDSNDIEFFKIGKYFKTFDAFKSIAEKIHLYNTCEDFEHVYNELSDIGYTIDENRHRHDYMKINKEGLFCNKCDMLSYFTYRYNMYNEQKKYTSDSLVYDELTSNDGKSITCTMVFIKNEIKK